MKTLNIDKMSEKQKRLLKWSNEKLVMKIINLQNELKKVLKK